MVGVTCSRLKRRSSRFVSPPILLLVTSPTATYRIIMALFVPPKDLALALGIQDDSTDFLPGSKVAATKVVRLSAPGFPPLLRPPYLSRNTR